MGVLAPVEGRLRAGRVAWLRRGLAVRPLDGGARLAGARLAGARLAGARLVGARLVGARLAGARLRGVGLVAVRLLGAGPGRAGRLELGHLLTREDTLDLGGRGVVGDRRERRQAALADLGCGRRRDPRVHPAGTDQPGHHDVAAVQTERPREPESHERQQHVREHRTEAATRDGEHQRRREPPDDRGPGAQRERARRRARGEPGRECGERDRHHDHQGDRHPHRRPEAAAGQRRQHAQHHEERVGRGAPAVPGREPRRGRRTPQLREGHVGREQRAAHQRTGERDGRERDRSDGRGHEQHPAEHQAPLGAERGALLHLQLRGRPHGAPLRRGLQPSVAPHAGDVAPGGLQRPQPRARARTGGAGASARPRDRAPPAQGGQRRPQLVGDERQLLRHEPCGGAHRRGDQREQRHQRHEGRARLAQPAVQDRGASLPEAVRGLGLGRAPRLAPSPS
ncbi:pentapeptide repeat-containing protein [Pseudactinotalea suaedae]|uniref:pentapeptide repeat-containing protein n=1 Tax=Pseudactinotalea suaedae TaxID=1524924 RepID=UPI00344E3831